MTDLTIYVGFDERDLRAFSVAMRSLRARAPDTVSIEPLLTWELRAAGLFSRPTVTLPNGQKVDCVEGRHQSTEFTLSRFLTPIYHTLMLGRTHPCAFIDPDVMARRNLAELVDLIDPSMLVQVVPHEHVPKPHEDGKIGGLIQQSYPRKNWSSLMIFPNPKEVSTLTGDVESIETYGDCFVDAVSKAPRDWLHGLRWVRDDMIGALPAEWNWLYGVEIDPSDPAIVHFTLGTPDVVTLDRDYYTDEWWEWFRSREWP